MDGELVKGGNTEGHTDVEFGVNVLGAIPNGGMGFVVFISGIFFRQGLPTFKPNFKADGGVVGIFGWDGAIGGR